MTATAVASNELESLYQQVTEWIRLSRVEGWSAAQGIVRPAAFGRHGAKDVEGLIIHTPSDRRIHFEPLGEDRDGSLILELYAWPTLERVRLRKRTGQEDWAVFTDTGIPFHMKWNRPSFIRLCRDLLAS